MASKKENLKSLFSNTRTRVVIFFTLILLIVAVLIGYLKLRHTTGSETQTSSLTQGPEGIQSIPGMLDPTAQYAKLQEQQNLNQAINAQKTGGSSIPTIIRTQAIGKGVGVIGASEGKGGVGFTALANEQEGGQHSLWIQALQKGNCSKAAVDHAVNEGAQLSDLKEACSCIQLKDVGYSMQELERVCQCKELKAAGYSARQLKEIGYSAARLKECDFSACELKQAGFSAQEMKDGGFSDGELKGAGFNEDEIAKTAGLPDGITSADVLKAGCTEAALSKLRKSGVSASAIRRISGCSVQQLKAAGFSAKELKDAGFSAADLTKAGFTPEELKKAGYSARDLLNAGLSPADLSKAGFTAAEIKSAENDLPPGISADSIKNSGCDADTLKKEKAAGVSAQAIKKYANCSAQALKAAGFTDTDLTNAGFTPEQIKASSALSDKDIKAAGCAPDELKKLLAAGVSAKRIKELNGCSAEALKNAGFNAKSLLDAGFTPEQLTAAGFSAQQLEQAGLSPAELIANGRATDCSVDALKKARAAGVSALTIKQTMGCSAEALKNAGYSAKDLKAAGFTAAELKGAGFNAKDLKDAGFSAKELHDAGFSPVSLKAAGFLPSDLKNAGLSAAELKSIGIESIVTPLKAPVIKLEPSNITKIKLPIATTPPNQIQANNDKLEAILNKQNEQQAEQKYQQKIQQRTAEMVAGANKSIQDWKMVTTQVYTEGNPEEEKKQEGATEVVQNLNVTNIRNENVALTANPIVQKSVIKTGDIVFAVLDTSVNTDEPGPILATIVSGKLKGTKLIGSFNLPANAEKMVITFNMMSVPGIDKTLSISAYAIDPNTARTALSSRTDHHFLMRYGSLFASSFLQGFGNAFQSANTTVTIGGTGGGNNITVSNGIGRSALENAVIGLAQVGQNWSQQAQQLFNTPTTVQVYSGTGIGVLFMQDIQF